MRKIVKLSGIMVAGLLFLTGCRGTTIYNVDNSPIESKSSLSKVYDAIKLGGTSKGWIITNVRPGLAVGKITVREHMAAVEIPYTENSFSIKYKDSLNLNYDPATGSIHSNYNGWVHNLEKAIQFQLAAIGN